MTKLYKEGQKVTALEQICENAQTGDGDPNAVFPDDKYIHAEKGETGTVEGVDPGLGNVPTVRFDRTKTATVVYDYEVELLEDE